MWRPSFDPVQREIHDLTGELIVIGVTGTKGKTTTATLIAHLLNHAGVPAALATSITSTIPGETPWPTCDTQTRLRDLLRRARELGVRHVVLESTSYSLSRGLADFCRYTGGVFTNLGHEHLTTHGTRDAYIAAKRRLFAALGYYRRDVGYGWAVLNADDEATGTMATAISPMVPVLRYGLPGCPGGVPRALHFYAARRRATRGGTRCEIVSPERLRLPVRLRLLGDHNVYNTLAGTAAAYCAGLGREQVQRGLEAFRPPPGRFEVVAGGAGRPTAVIDYAHTPESLAAALQAARLLAGRRRVWVVFGCGGETSPSKRPLMGRAAAVGSDQVIVTTDNPRAEDPAAIAAEVLAGARGGPASVTLELDRRAAIATALAAAGPGDVVLVAGKGHETEQILATGPVPFSDREVVLALLGLA